MSKKFSLNNEHNEHFIEADFLKKNVKLPKAFKQNISLNFYRTEVKLFVLRLLE